MIPFLVFSGPKWIDFNEQYDHLVTVDRESGQYLGHPTTLTLRDGKTILCVYPKGHGKGAIILKKSLDGGLTWSDRLGTPKSWETSLETPTIHRIIDPHSHKDRLLLWSGLYPARLSSSDDQGQHWTELQTVGNWGGIVVMSSLIQLKSGRILAWFHDDGRFFGAKALNVGLFTVYQTQSDDGGRTWTVPRTLSASTELQICEPGVLISPDNSTISLILRENKHRQYSQIISSQDSGQTWSSPRPLFAEVTGDRHVTTYAKDGRLVFYFRDTMQGSPWWGDWVAWVGSYDDLMKGRKGQYRIRIKDNLVDGDCAYTGVENLSDGTLVATTYGHWDKDQEPYILTSRFKLSEIDRFARKL